MTKGALKMQERQTSTGEGKQAQNEVVDLLGAGSLQQSIASLTL